MVKSTDVNEPSTRFEARSKELFDASVFDTLDGRTRSALTQARHAALAELERSRRSWARRALGPLTGIAAAAFVLLVLFAPLQVTLQSNEAEIPPLEDLSIAAEVENFELLEDLEFYVWLDSADALPSEG